jgi:hypothetical protein
MEKRTVYSGICTIDGKLVCGIPEPQDFCDQGSWLPPHVIADKGHPHRGCAHSPDKVVIGRCGVGGPCSNMAVRCDDPASFMERDPDCRLTRDYGPSGAYTTYGKCGDGRCVWSPLDCEEGDDYTRNDDSCTADKVTLGACLDGYGYCTVSPKTCANVDGSGSVEPYYTHSAFLEKFNAFCYLSDLPTTRAPVAPSAAPVGAVVVPTMTGSPTPGPFATATLTATATSTATTTKTGGMSQSALLGITIGTTLVVGIAIGFIGSRIFANVRAKRTLAPPLKKISLGRGRGREIVVDPGEDLSIA